MGTRADFYVGRGESAEWLGSIAWDGYPNGIPDDIHQSANEEMYREEVQAFLESREDATLPEQGWPWPWDDSQTTDYAYAFEKGWVYAVYFGHRWFCPQKGEEEPDVDGYEAIFPDMSDRKNVTLGPRSGLIVLYPGG